MEQKLLSALPARTAWSVLGICAFFWLLSALGLLQLPSSVPSVLMFLWLYLNALATLASALAAAAAAAALLLHRRFRRHPEEPEGLQAPASLLDLAEETGLDQLLEGPASPPAAQAAGTAAARAKRNQSGKGRKR
ncbi:hypothetical protein ITX31_10425 [Arthrobacter gandavensis]|uniref:hypothetical protein n=1 Tax=Arthrobacter gandavensis TaxID=169960 RepID=UPI00188FEE8D|nr:hypothetical protein [Arthrobacter gandavensis]MBF4994525.1 hypothetical protein [Arthrobacter gandavensis]